MDDTNNTSSVETSEEKSTETVSDTEPKGATTEESGVVEKEAVKDDFTEWKESIQEKNPQIDDKTAQAIWTAPNQRTWRQTELNNYALHPDYEQQVSFKMDPKTGQAVEVPYGTKGSQRPDGIIRNDGKVEAIIEDKNYKNADSLIQNIKKQTEARRELFGDDVKMSYVLSPKFTCEEAEKIQQVCEGELGVEIEYE